MEIPSAHSHTSSHMGSFTDRLFGFTEDYSAVDRVVESSSRSTSQFNPNGAAIEFLDDAEAARVNMRTMASLNDELGTVPASVHSQQRFSDPLVEQPFGGSDVRALSRSSWKRLTEPVVQTNRAMDGDFDLTKFQVQDYHGGERGRASAEPENISRSAFHSASAGLVAAVFSLFNDILSSGIVAMPLYVVQTGVVPFAVLMVFMGWLTVRTVDDLYFLSRKFQKYSYAELCEYSLGRPGYLLCCFFMFVFNGGGLVVNLQLLGLTLVDFIHGFTDSDFFIIDRHYMILFSVALFSPFTFFRNVTHFKFNSVISLFSLCVVIGVVVVMAFVEWNAPPFDPWYKILIPPINIDVMGGIAGISFLFVCHDMSFSVYDEIHNPTRKRSSRVIQVTMLMTVLCFSAIAFGGYFTYYGDVQANIVSNYSPKSIPAMVARVFIIIAIASSVPFMCFMPRLSIYAVMAMLCGRFIGQHKLIFHIFSTIFVLGLALSLALIFNNLGATYEFVGAVSAVGLAWILPPLVYLRLERKGWLSFVTIQKILILLFGLFSMVGGVTSAVLQAVQGQ